MDQMSLPSLQLKEIADLNNFIISLQRINLIQRKPWSRFMDGKLFQANDNNIYFINDIQDFIETASDEELRSSKITFTTHKNQVVTLAQIKADTNYYQQLVSSMPAALIMEIINLEFYSDSIFCSLNTVEELNAAEHFFKNQSLYFNVRLANSIPLLLETIFPGLILSSNYKVQALPFPPSINPYDIMDHVTKDVLLITYQQQIKFKSHLIKQKIQSDNQLVKDRIVSIIKEIDDHHTEVKSLFKSRLAIAQKQLAQAESFQQIYQQHVQSDPGSHLAKNKIKDLGKELESIGLGTRRRESLYKILRPTVSLWSFNRTTNTILSCFIAYSYCFRTSCSITGFYYCCGTFSWVDDRCVFQ